MATTEELVLEILNRPNIAAIVAYTTDRAAQLKDVAKRTFTVQCGISGLPSVIERLQTGLEEFIEQD